MDITISAFTFSGCFFFALLSLCRFSVPFGFLDRPFVAGLLWSLCMGDWTLASTVVMPLAIFYELLWIDLFPAGTYAPPNGVLPLFLVLTLGHMAGWSTAAEFFVPMILAIFAAECCTRLESWLRSLNNRRYDTLLLWAARAQGQRTLLYRDGIEQSEQVSVSSPTLSTPRSLIRASLFEYGAIQFVVFVIWLLVLFVTFWVMERFLGLIPSKIGIFMVNGESQITWPLLWFAAAMGGILSLRIQKAYCAYAITVAVLSFAIFLLK